MKVIYIALIIVGATSVAIATTQFSNNYFTGKLGERTQQFYLSTETRVQSEELTFANLFVTHGHCSTPFSANIENLRIDFVKTAKNTREMENMLLTFDINPNTFLCPAGEEYTEQLKKQGLFTDEENSKISFQSTAVYTVGTDWYQINGTLKIKGIEHDMTLFATGIRESEEISSLIIQGQLDLKNWGIDYDQIVFGDKNEETPTRWMYLNTRFNLRGC